MEPYSFGAPLISVRNRRYSDGLDSWGHRGRTMRRLFLVAAFATSLQFASAANTPVRAGGGRCDGRPHRWPRGRDHYRCRSCRSTLRRTASGICSPSALVGVVSWRGQRHQHGLWRAHDRICYFHRPVPKVFLGDVEALLRRRASCRLCLAQAPSRREKGFPTQT